ncbi:MAG: flavin reductase family protein [Dehalococcoidia bacterium]|jgi:flavin reductase (DIM6/NTAB) family NADH-FMN oxidoreductase RutF
MVKSSISGCGNFYHHYPSHAAVITAQFEGKKGIMAAAWHAPISRTPPLFGISLAPKRYTYKLIEKAKEFAINFLSFDKAELLVSVGSVSGAEVDKYKKFGIKTEKPIKTTAPILNDAYATYECRLIDSRKCGDHIWIIGKVVATHFDKALFTSDETIDLNRVSPILYMGADRYTIPSGADVKVIERGR